ncbi:Sialic acid TRAP transporter permease protein SiaT [Pelagimonas phthalicica]|uniref:Sialic acid TRAP transporter permease protein SiaT n=1 Tax=Pelagimonas phthalicica TaxID=1037362 RepID=A0A238J9P3_9RHOB|nr:TRAP transporter permease [Pelagimonas phthalicica]TDS94875.1 TRAP transporter 4TM/12TM fusion protein [Pelagimonas phthalicica]SMX26596.1 Sialic acid TRAP transporter permease protein SiaT [Pelagimonas phthalicica]
MRQPSDPETVMGDNHHQSLIEQETARANVDEEPLSANQRDFDGTRNWVIAILCASYTVFHLAVMNVYPLETWAYRLSHVGGGLALGFLLYSSTRFSDAMSKRSPLSMALLALAGAGILYGFAGVAAIWINGTILGERLPPAWAMQSFGLPLALGTGLAILNGWLFPDRNRARFDAGDVLLAIATIAAIGYIIFFARQLQLRAGMPMALPGDMWASITGVMLIIELTRRLAGMALVIIVGIFVAYAFLGPWLPGIFQHRGYDAKRFFSYIFTDNGILSAPIAISSTYIILFVVFAAFLQTTRVGEYFVNLAFAAAGHKRGGPAKVAIFASGLMGMINGTSAGNVVATGSLTIPMMKKVGYKPQTSASVEAAASTGGQIMPPIMGAGAFIMAEITGISYMEIVYAAIIPAVIYFISVYFMVDLAAQKADMKGLPRDQLPKLNVLIKQVYLFSPILVLIGALFAGYSVIRCGTYAMMAAAVVSWFTPHAMGPARLFHALDQGARMVLQLVAVCATAGIIVGVIALTGIGARFSTVLLSLADQSQIFALFFAMVVSIILGMGMPTTAAYAVAASVIAPGVINLGVEPLVAHLFIFYFAVMSAITPPVALAAYAGSALAGSDPVRTSVESFRIGLAAFVVPYMFFFSPAMLLDGAWHEILHVAVTAVIGVYLLSCAVQGWFLGHANMVLRGLLALGGLSMIAGGWLSDGIGIGVAALCFFFQKQSHPAPSQD